MDTSILNCACGCGATIKSKSVTFGQGMFGDEYWVEATCGFQGKHFDTYDNKSITAIEKAVNTWNAHILNVNKI